MSVIVRNKLAGGSCPLSAEGGEVPIIDRSSLQQIGRRKQRRVRNSGLFRRNPRELKLLILLAGPYRDGRPAVAVSDC